MRVFSLFAIVTLLSACAPFQPMSPSVGVGQRRLEVRFATPTQLVGQTASGDRVVRERVRWIVGRPLMLRNDSLVLRVERWGNPDNWWWESPPFVSVLATTDSGITFGTRRASGRRIATFVLAAPFAAYILLWIMCESGQCPIPAT
jgi:hypothetical protein